jgi:hypothetical protein
MEEMNVWIFSCIRTWRGEPVNHELDKCDDLYWGNVIFLSRITIPYVGQAIQSHLKGIHFDKFG